MGKGWFFKVQVTHTGEFEQLLDVPAYDALVKTL